MIGPFRFKEQGDLSAVSAGGRKRRDRSALEADTIPQDDAGEAQISTIR